MDVFPGFYVAICHYVPSLDFDFDGWYFYHMAKPSIIGPVEERIFGDYCVRKYPTIKGLAEAYDIHPKTLKRHIARKGWVDRRSELERQVALSPQNAEAAIKLEVADGTRPPADVIAARRIRLRQEQAQRIEDKLGEYVERVVGQFDSEGDALSLPARVATLESLVRVKAGVFGETEKSNSHGRNVAILIGFMPSQAQ
jgi:hypothetical protein